MTEPTSNPNSPSGIGAAAVLVVGAVLLWPQVDNLSRFTPVFVDRSAAAETCMTARTIDDNLPPLPRTDGGLIDYFGSSTHAAEARAARAAERRSREIQLRAAAERSRDRELSQAAVAGPEAVLRVCVEKGYPR